jgi:hypothetical protein
MDVTKLHESKIVTDRAMVQQGKLRWIGSITWRKLLPLAFFVVVSLSTNAAEISPTVSKAAAPPWEKLSDQQIVRLLFPKEKLYFEPTIEQLPETEPLDGVAVYETKRVVANFDNDPEDEMAVLIIYNTALLYAEYTKAVFAILDIMNEEIKIRWRTEEGEAFPNAPLDVSAIKLISKDKFLALACTYDTAHVGMGSSYQKMKVIRWNGKNFSEIWNYKLKSYDSGGRGGIPHEYSATVDFLDADKTAKRIRVSATFTYQRNEEHLRKQYKLNEEFVWSEKEQKYLPRTHRKVSSLPLLKVHSVGLPSAKEFPLFNIRDLRSEGLDTVRAMGSCDGGQEIARRPKCRESDLRLKDRYAQTDPYKSTIFSRRGTFFKRTASVFNTTERQREC